jgi:hypothetical protein
MSLFFNICASSGRKSILTELSGVNNPFPSTVTDYLHFISYGQSLAGGAEGQPMLSVANVGGNVTLEEEWHMFLHPVTPNLDTFYPMEFDGSTTNTYIGDPSEGPVVGWANAFKTGLAREIPNSPFNNSKILASTTGKGGSTIAELAKGTTPYDNQFMESLRAGKRAADLEGKTISAQAILFMQAESEPASRTKEQYIADALQLFTNMRNDVMAIYGQTEPPAIIVYQPKAGPRQIKAAYEELFKTTDWIICAGPIYYTPFYNVHLDSNAYRWFGEQVAKAHIQTLKDNKKFNPLMIIDSFVSGNQVTITFNRDIVIDTVSTANRTSYLPALNQYAITVTSHQIINGNQMVMTTTTSDLETVGEILLSVGESRIRDEDTYLATSIYEDYVPLEGKAVAENQTVDSNGDIIYGQTYPMWNWLADTIDYKIQ